MVDKDITVQFENAVRKALGDFKQRLEQQRFFQMQNNLLKKMYEEVRIIGYCDSETVKELSLEYEDFYWKLKGSGRSYENILEEKNLTDTYSAFEKFLFDCFCSIYAFFPKYLGNQVNINTSDLFIAENIELCKKNIIESKVKNFIQSNNIMEIINGFRKEFSIKNIESCVSEDEKNILCEISLIRNLVIHNNSIVNRIYIEQLKKFLKDKVKYQFDEGDTVLNKLEDLVQDIKDISTRVCEKIADAIINDSKRLEKYHETKG
ncbi:MAG: hypothetical protein BWK80_00765 [Desulfobacteraceae bacterium IS3]|nr:MAG: hypothetical protein BWK80_00765 [Desulfobacteraceae bacterium IS3]